MSASSGRSSGSLPSLPDRAALLNVPTLLHEFDSGSKLYISNNSAPRDFDTEFGIDRRIVFCSDSTGRLDDSVAMIVKDKVPWAEFIFSGATERYWAGDKQWKRYARQDEDRPYELSEKWAQIEERFPDWISKGYNIRANCIVGQSRSGTAVIALLVKFAGMSLFDACVKVRSVRPLVAPGYFTQQLMGYAHLNDKLLGDGITEENAVPVFSRLLPLIEDVTATKDPKGKWLFTPKFMGVSAGRTTYYPFAADPSFRELYEKKKDVIFESWEGQAMSTAFEMEKIVQQVRDARMRIPEIPAEWKLKALGLWILYRHRCYAIDQDDTHGLVATLGVLPPFFLGEGRNPFALDYGVDLGGGHASAGQARPGGTSPPKGKGPSKRARKVAASAAMLRNALAAGITEDELDDMLASLELDDD